MTTPTTLPTLAEMMAEVVAVNTEKGWYDQEVTLGEYVALLQSETGEALDAWRKHGLEDATDPDGDRTVSMRKVNLAKPEGVGSEMADVFIRFLDMTEAHNLAALNKSLRECMDSPLADIPPWAGGQPYPGAPDVICTFGEHMGWINRCAGDIWCQELTGGWYTFMAIITTCDTFNINLHAEYTRKIAYNRTRPYRHGGKRL